MSEATLATILLAAPFLSLSAIWLIGLTLLFKPARVVARKEVSYDPHPLDYDQ